MQRSRRPVAPPAQLTLRAHRPSPARVELVRNSRARRLTRMLLWLVVCWGVAPLVLWIPPHYPWFTAALLLGAYLGHRSWKGRYTVHSFAGICPRCGAAVSLGPERTFDFPFTLTCFSCHFEPRLHVDLDDAVAVDSTGRLEHHIADCVGIWETRWLADERFVICGLCRSGAPATDEILEQADAENATAKLLHQLANEGRPMI